MFGFAKKGVALAAPVAGEVIGIESVHGDVFSQKILGDGFGVVPEPHSDQMVVCAPAPGTIVSLFPTGHAFGIETDDGLEILVHIGLDTVEMKGDGFQAHLAKGAHVDAGSPVVTVDLAKVRAAGCDPIVLVVLTNKNQVKSLSLDLVALATSGSNVATVKMG